ncbi:biotin/lipoyl-binding protein [Ruminococcus sp. Marseille-P6503]|uniref:efflux RND transporter periplasmic adaptor subunit n=1 Tax=Ruminococcus sp. Marseille-P6503 TaxID=2364796 RepID=UPI000F54968C|nr:biotin/lipoyl-binding protein [Ruminococcus sp. Marseille-P6503]
MRIAKIYKSITCSALAAAIACLTAGCYLLPDEEEVLPAPTVKASEVKYTTVTAQKKDLEKKVVNSGTVTAEKQYNLVYEKQGGTISAFHVHAGDTVKSGDPICELDTQELDYQIAEKELYLKRAQLNVDVIYESGGTQSEIDKAYVDVELLNHELQKLYDQKDAATLKTPVDGTVYSLADVRVGDSVNTGQTIATIIDTSELYIAIKPTDSRVYKMGTEVKIRIDENYYKGEVFMTPDELADYQAEQAQSHDKLDDTGIAFEAETVYVRFTDEIPTDSVGQLADCILIQDSVQDAIVISNNLIKTVDGEQVVYVLKDGEKTAVKVETGLETGSQTEIISGLSEGDELVLR